MRSIFNFLSYYLTLVCLFQCYCYYIPKNIISSISCFKSIRPSRFSLYSTSKTKQLDNCMTLTRFMIEATRSDSDHADLEGLITSIQLACKTIGNIISKTGADEMLPITTPPSLILSNNVVYEMANDLLRNSLKFSGKIGILQSEDDEKPILIEEAWNSQYIAVFDPLDGALNIDVGIVTGTIFGIFKESSECLVDYGESIENDSTKNCLLQTLQNSSNLVAAGYCMYSSTTILMFSMGNGLHGFTLDPVLGEFVLTHPNVQIPKRGKIYSFNEAYSYQWPSGVSSYINDIKQGLGEAKHEYTSRYIGSLIGDIHRTILYGGIFGYPGNRKYPNGKVRIVHEASPIAFLVEQAGGKASSGTKRLLDIQINDLNQHSPVYFGSEDDVTELEKYILDDSKK